MRAAIVELTYADVPMVCEAEYDPGERRITTGPSDHWHPGCSPMASLMACKVGDVDILPLLDADTIERIESEIVVRLEG